MPNPNHFIKCGKCGVEFMSMFAGASSVIGCAERCPNCKAKVPTPLFSNQDNFDSFQRASQEPMIREYGEEGKDGYVLMVKNHLAFSVRSPSLIPIYAAYDRNIFRTLDLIDVFYEMSTERKQVILSTIYISTMTAYECLTEDLLKAIYKDRIAVPPKGRTALWERRKHLFETLNFNIDGHTMALRYLYAFRNCLTHNAGVVDDDFLKNIKRIGMVPQQLSGYSTGQPLILDALTATSFANSLQETALRLFNCAQALYKKWKNPS